MEASHKHRPGSVHVAFLLVESVGLPFNKLRYRVNTAVTMKNVVLWDVTPCSVYKSADVSK